VPDVPRSDAGGLFVHAPRLGADEVARLLGALDALARLDRDGRPDRGRGAPCRCTSARPGRSRTNRGRPGASRAAPRPGELAMPGRAVPPAQRSGGAEVGLASVRVRLAGAVRPSSGGAVELERSCCLDLAAELSELAETLHRRGRVVEALALEGVEGRLLGALVGAGPFEPDALDATGRR